MIDIITLTNHTSSKAQTSNNRTAYMLRKHTPLTSDLTMWTRPWSSNGTDRVVRSSITRWVQVGAPGSTHVPPSDKKQCRY